MAGIGSRFSGCSGERSAAAAGFHVPRAPSTTPPRLLAETNFSHHLLSSSSRAYHAGTSRPGQAGLTDAVGPLDTPPQPPPSDSLSHLAPSLALLASLSDICASSSTPAPGSRVKPGSEHNFEASGAYQESDAPSPCRMSSAFSSYRRPASFREAPICVLSDSNLCLQATVGLGNLYYDISRKIETETSVAAAAAAVAQWDGCWSRESSISGSSKDLKGKTVFRSISERVPEGRNMVCVSNDGGQPGGPTLQGSLSLKHSQQQQQQMYDQMQYLPGNHNGVYSDTLDTMKRAYLQSESFNAQYQYQLQQHQSMLGNKQILAPRGLGVEPDQMCAPGRIAMDGEPAGDNDCSEIDWTMPGGQLKIGPHLPLLAGRYRYLEALSEGGSAKVFTAVDLLHPRRRTVVIKAMHKHYREVGLQEQQLLRHLNSMDPDDSCHIVRLISGFDFKGHTCLVLERLQGSLLEHMCAPERQAQTLAERVEEIRRLALHLIVALATLHSAGVIHGDLKPENVLLQASCSGGSMGCSGGAPGGSSSPTFSLPGSCSCSGLSSSSSFSSRSSSSGMSSWADASRASGCTGASVGVKLADLGNSFTPEQIKGLCRDFNVQTLAYRAPEVLLGVPFDARIDMWSLGCILAELALGRLLFACDCPSQLLQQMGAMLGLPPPRYLFGHGKFFQQLFEEASLSTTEDPYESLLGAPAMAAAAAAAAAGSSSNWPTPGCGVYNPAAQGSLLPVKLNFCSPGRSYLGDVLLKVDAQLADLVCCLLQYDPSCRLTAHQALLHPFFAPLFPFRTLFGVTPSANNMQPQDLNGLLPSSACSPQHQMTWNNYQQQQQQQHLFHQQQLLQQQAVVVRPPCASPLDCSWLKPLPSVAAPTTSSPDTLPGRPASVIQALAAASPFTLGPAALASGAHVQSQQHSQRLLQIPSQLQLAEQQQLYHREQLQQQQWQQPQQVLHAGPTEPLSTGWSAEGAPAQSLGGQQLLGSGASNALSLSTMQQQKLLLGASSGAQAALAAMDMVQRNQLGTMRNGSSDSTSVESPVEAELLSGNGRMAYASTACQQQQQQQLPQGMGVNKAPLLQAPTLTLSQQQSHLDASTANWAAGPQAQVSFVPSTPGPNGGAGWGSSHHVAWAGAGGRRPGPTGTRTGASVAEGLGSAAAGGNNASQTAWDINVEPDRSAQAAALHAGYAAGRPAGACPAHVPSKRAMLAASTLVVEDGGPDAPVVGNSLAGAPPTPFKGSEGRPRVSWSRSAKAQRMPEGAAVPPPETASNGGVQAGVSKSASQSWGKALQMNEQWGAGYPSGLMAVSQQGGGLNGPRLVGEDAGDYGGPSSHLLQGSKSMHALQQQSAALQSVALIQQQQIRQAQQQQLLQAQQQQQLLQAQQQQQQLMLQQQQSQHFMGQQQQPQQAGHFVQPYMASGHQLASVQPTGNAGGLFAGSYAYLSGLRSNGLVA